VTLSVPDIPVLIAGAGPIGLTAAIELARRGIDFRIVDPLLDPPRSAKAVGVQPRTLEIFEGMGVLRRILDAGIRMNGQIVYVNGQEVARMEFPLLDDVPFGFLSIPQYQTERILREELALRGVQVERGIRLTGFVQDDDGVTATLSSGHGEQTVRAGYLIGADGAHSIVRQTLGLTFEGATFEEAVHARRRRGRLVDAARLRNPVDAPDRRHHRRPAGVHSTSGPGPLPDVDAGARRAERRS
jgi:pentachlorophenol monooxygenase